VALGNTSRHSANGPVGGHHGAFVLVTSADEFEQEIGMAVGVGQVADLVDDQQVRARVGVQTPAVALNRCRVRRDRRAAGRRW